MNIGFKDLRIMCIIGVNPDERQLQQEIFVDLKAEIDYNGQNSLESTVDYTALAALCEGVAVNGKYLLLEKYANDLAEQLKTRFPLRKLWLRVKKPQALPGAAYAYVEKEL